MPVIHPFPALLPKPELAARICELPYDVVSSAEAREIARNNPLSFFHISKPEIDLDPSIDVHDPRVYAKGHENFQRLIQKDVLVQDTQPSFYLYRQVMGKHTQVGLVTVTRCEDYVKNLVKKHELTRPDKEEDRVHHIETLNAQTGPAFLIYRTNSRIDTFVANKIREKPSVDFIASDDIQHTAWPISSRHDISFLQGEFEKIPYLYIADGHHRSAAAVRVWKKRSALHPPSFIPHPSPLIPHSSSFFLTVLFPHNQVQIFPYHRIVKDLHGLGLDRFVQRMRELGSFEIHAQTCPTRKHEICIFLDGIWHVFRWKTELIAQENAIGQFDVSLLQKHILVPLLGINDPRTSTRIKFAGGIRGTEELEQSVRSGEWAVAFSMFPIGVEDLMQIADQGRIMPPKSTWFEPKLRDGMFCHLLEPLD